MKRFSALLLSFFLLLVGCGQTPPDGETGAEQTRDNTGEQEYRALEEHASEAILSEENLQRNPPEGYSLVFVQDSDGTDDGVQRLIASMEAQGIYFYATTERPQGLFGPEDVVLLKINCQWAERGGTSTDLLALVIQALADHPEGFRGEIVVADNGQAQYGTNGTGGSLDWPGNNAQDTSQSVMTVIERFQEQGMAVSGLLWDTITHTRVQEYEQGDMRDGYVVGEVIQTTGVETAYPKFTTEYSTSISFKEGIWLENEGRYDQDRLKILNMPVLKSHNIYQVTGAIKAYMGVTSDSLTDHRAHETVGMGGMGTLMAGTRMPTLNLMDMIWVGADQGPITTYANAVEVKRIAASTDPVALDYWASKYVLMPEAEKLPGGRAPAMSPDGTTPGTFGYWLRLSMQELVDAGYPVTMDEAFILVWEG